MARVSSREARKVFGEIIDRARYAKERTVITRNGKDAAAIVSMQDLRLLEAALDRIEYQEDVESAREALADYERNGGTPLEEIVDRLNLK